MDRCSGRQLNPPAHSPSGIQADNGFQGCPAIAGGEEDQERARGVFLCVRLGSDVCHFHWPSIELDQVTQ